MKTENTCGTVEAVSQKGNSYGILVGGEWYNGWGESPATKGEYVMVNYTMSGKYRNIVSVEMMKEPGEGGEVVDEIVKDVVRDYEKVYDEVSRILGSRPKCEADGLAAVNTVYIELGRRRRSTW